MSAGLTDSQSRAIRGALQLVAGGALDLIVRQLGADLDGRWFAPYVPLIYALAVSWAQNYLEAAGVIKEVLKPSHPGGGAGA